MASKDHAPSNGPDPVSTTGDSMAAAPVSSQPVMVDNSDSALKSSSPADAPGQNTTATDSLNTSTADNGDNPPVPSNEVSAGAPGSTPISPDEEPKLATPVPELASDASVKEPEDSGPSLTIVLLLISGTRYPIKIDSNYLRKRDITVDNNDPFAMSVYTLKELIWRSWQEGRIVMKIMVHSG